MFTLLEHSDYDSLEPHLFANAELSSLRATFVENSVSSLTLGRGKLGVVRGPWRSKDV